MRTIKLEQKKYKNWENIKYMKGVEGFRSFSENGKWFTCIDIETFCFEKYQQYLDGIVDLEELEKKIELCRLEEKRNNFKTFFEDISELIKKNSGKEYTIVGDIIDESRTGYTMIYSYLPDCKNMVLHIFDPKGLAEKSVVNKTVEVTGIIHWYELKQEVQLKLTRAPRIIYYTSRMEEQWLSRKEEFSNEIKNKDTAEVNEPKTANKLCVALVAGEKTEGYRDFEKRIQQQNERYANIAPIEIQNYLVPQMEPGAIKGKIDIINKEVNGKMIDYICIVRGGGDKVKMFCDYSLNNDLINAIINSSVPICTGIGHSTDESICDLVADCHATTPSEAARKMIEIVRGWKRGEQEKEKENLKKEKINWEEKYRELAGQYNSLEEYNNMLCGEINALKDKNEKLSKRLEEYEKKERKGFFRRLFNL